ncbi:MAG TPA: hypothetical protein VGF39_04005 [Stellaceae bacterium]
MTKETSDGAEFGRWPTYPKCPDCGANTWQLGPLARAFGDDGAEIGLFCTDCDGRFSVLIFRPLAIRRLKGVR